MKFEWNTHKVTLFSELFFVIDLVYTWESEHPFTNHLPTPMIIVMKFQICATKFN